MAKSLIAAVLIAVALVGAVVVPTAITRGTFAFDAWPEASSSHAHDQQVVVTPAEERTIARAERASAPPGSGNVETPAATAKPSTAPAETPAATPHPRTDAPVAQPSSHGGAAEEAPPAPVEPEPSQDLASGEPGRSPDAQTVDARPVVADPGMPASADDDGDDPEPQDDVEDTAPLIIPPVGGLLHPPGWHRGPRRPGSGRPHR